MIRIGRLTDYGVSLLVTFARHDSSKAMNARDLSQESKLPLPTVSKLLKALCRTGILVSQRGVNGGYRLSRPANEITLATVVEALEGPIAITHCCEGAKADACERRGFCIMGGKWEGVTKTFRKALDDVSLADLARTGDQSVRLEVVPEASAVNGP